MNNYPERSTNRKYSIDLIKILAMYLIILHHLVVHGILPLNLFSNNFIIASSFSYWTGHVGNYLFMIVTGYLMFNSSLKIRKLLNVWLQMFVFSIIIGLSLFILKKNVMSDNHIFSIIDFVYSVFIISLRFRHGGEKITNLC